MFSDVLAVAVLVPLLVVPWKYIVPPDPPLAVIVVLPQNVPPPLTVVADGTELIVTFTLPCVPQQPPFMALK